MKPFNEIYLEVAQAFERNDYPQMIKLADPLAQVGVAWAQGVIGSLYHSGLGMPPDLTRAETLYLKAHSKGDELSTLNLVAVYEELGNIEEANRFRQECIDRGIGLYGGQLKYQDELERDSEE